MSDYCIVWEGARFDVEGTDFQECANQNGCTLSWETTLYSEGWSCVRYTFETQSYNSKVMVCEGKVPKLAEPMIGSVTVNGYTFRVYGVVNLTFSLEGLVHHASSSIKKYTQKYSFGLSVRDMVTLWKINSGARVIWRCNLCDTHKPISELLMCDCGVSVCVNSCLDQMKTWEHCMSGLYLCKACGEYPR